MPSLGMSMRTTLRQSGRVSMRAGIQVKVRRRTALDASAPAAGRPESVAGSTNKHKLIAPVPEENATEIIANLRPEPNNCHAGLAWAILASTTLLSFFLESS